MDVRANGGGNVSRMLIERLSRKLLAAQFARTSDDAAALSRRRVPRPDGRAAERELVVRRRHLPGHVPRGEARSADRQAQSWGGVVGITNHGQLIDGGTVNVPEFGFANAKGEWIIEGHGVDPDIEVENDPRSVIQGKDPQLERGVAEVMKKLEARHRRGPSGRPIRSS